MALGCSVPLILVGWVVLALSGLGGPNPGEARAGWSLLGVGVVLFLWGVFSGAAKRRRRERAREERVRKRESA
jgi:hypothetical protein